MAVFSSEKYAALGRTSGERKMIVPDGSWIKCSNCGQMLYTDRLEDNLQVCWYCDCHLPMRSAARIKMLTDEGSFVELWRDLRSIDALNFSDTKSYAVRLEDNRRKSGLEDAVICGSAMLDGRPYMLGVMDFSFMGASMGSVVGERIARMLEAAAEGRNPAVMVTASGGARMQEGILSLMQMPKTCGALQRLAEAGVPFIVVLTNPTYGGVTASFASLGDVILAEPGAMVGFAGPRVIQETTNSKLPDGFQTAEFLMDKGLVDCVVERKNLRRELANLLEYFGR